MSLLRDIGLRWEIVVATHPKRGVANWFDFTTEQPFCFKSVRRRGLSIDEPSKSLSGDELNGTASTVTDIPSANPRNREGSLLLKRIAEKTTK